MNHIISKLLMYGDMEEDSILMQLSGICEAIENESESIDRLRTRLFVQVKRILQVATDYGFNKNCGTIISHFYL